MDKNLVRTSKFISLCLRHKPEAANLTMDKEGWVNVNELINALQRKGHNISADILEKIVKENNKKRFAYNENKTKIRASQGHSIDIDLKLKEKEPPELLYHGTASQTVKLIKKNGLKKMNRQHVHLSPDKETAVNVGKRHGYPVVLEIKAKKMHEDGCKFYLSKNRVWLTDYVDIKYISLL